MSPRLEMALRTAHLAGRSTLAHFHAGTAVETKFDDTPVTVADKRAERMIREALERDFPGEHILGEEEGGDEAQADRWVVDPIDGTKAFVAGVPTYCTLLSYEIDRRPILGICYFPAQDLMFYAERGAGAFENGRPVRVSSRPLDGAILCCGGLKSMRRLGRLEPFLDLAERAMEARTWGDGWGYCLVASGRAEAMIDPKVALWDVSAVSLIVEEAGGRFTRPDGGDALEAQDGGYSALATNGVVHDEMVRAFSRP